MVYPLVIKNNDFRLKSKYVPKIEIRLEVQLKLSTLLKQIHKIYYEIITPIVSLGKLVMMVIITFTIIIISRTLNN